MTDYRQYLLRTDAQIAKFREKYAGHIEKNRHRFVSWINALPVCEKVNYLAKFKVQHHHFVVGMLCILVIEGAININFHGLADRIDRNPRDIQEWEAWCQSRMTKRRRP